MMLGNSGMAKVYSVAAEHHAAIGWGGGMDVERYI